MHRRCLLALFLLAPLAAQAEDEGPTTPVNALDAGLLAVMRAGRATPFDARVQTLTPVVAQSFDLQQILQISIGPRFASFSAAQQSELLSTFAAYTVASYVANFDAFNGERFEVLPDIRHAGADEVVQTRVIPTTGDPTRLDYVVRPVGGQPGGVYKIVDVLLDGSISRVAVQRSDFRSLLATGDPEPLIAMLRNKVAGLAAGNKV